ncbi:hypothetical protein [Pseudoflavonifractor phocaeensis]|uniref:hypothetical protein n=1 Tax=Pseudoflavonifractor phocaeensis TaxID=1870988 RepID=UPI002109A39F|nr:hypothetical protein [Pseudoflavonifractor phocaeensis]MCQ4864938.1 hypothetical protein [Pseudoflavonifractor phocaeensis]
MRLSDLLSNIPSDEYLTELWPARVYSSRKKGPYITRQGLIMVALYYEGYLHTQIAEMLVESYATVNSMLPRTLGRLEKVHVFNDMSRKLYGFPREITPGVLKPFCELKPIAPAMEVCRQEWQSAADELVQVRAQRNMLFRYLARHSDIDVDLCLKEECAGRCPNDAHCGNSQHCRNCVLSHLKTLEKI